MDRGRTFADRTLAAWRWLLLAALSALALCLLPAAAQNSRAVFDHQSTAFPLNGQHQEVRCETCHQRGIFKGTPRDCAGCHVSGNPMGAVFQPVRHLLTQQSCDSCHNVNGFPGARFDHAGVAGGTCAGCHDGVQAKGKSPGHLATTSSCDVCHKNTLTFAGAATLPSNHIPFAAAASCENCHVAGDYKNRPTLTNIHAWAPSTTGNCQQCHGSDALRFKVQGMAPGHLPTSAACETCHVGAGSSVATLPVTDGASFANSLMNHAGISSGCASCHLPAGTAASFAGVGSIVKMPATSPPGPDAHIPTTLGCETCHLASMPATPVAPNATTLPPGSRFRTPAPTSAQIHTGVTGSCATCHETGYTWVGMDAYPMSPATFAAGATYTGFHSRPRPAGGPTNIADAAHPATGDCSSCHSGTSGWTGVAVPSNHIPYASGASCLACHVGGDFKTPPKIGAIHANLQSTTGNCQQCHGAAAPSFAIPASGFSIVGLPSNHIPTSASCEVCHVGPGSSVAATPVPDGAKFSGSLMSHTGISGNCVACHQPAGSATSFAGITGIVGMPSTAAPGPTSHIPSSTVCENCHLGAVPATPVPASATKSVPGSGFAVAPPTGAQIHSGISSGCSACHEAGFVWVGVSAYPISPSTLVPGASYRGFQTRPRAAAGTYNVADASHPTTGDCAACHGSTTAFSGIDKPANHIPVAAGSTCNACHTSTDFAVMPTLTAIHANAPSTTSNCALCHGANASFYAIPSIGFSIVGLPSNHLPTTASCEVCHVGPGSSIAATPVTDGARFSGSLMNHAGIGSGCASCHVPAGGSVSFAGITAIVGQPPTSPVGAGSHIPAAVTTCESCHLASTPVGLIPASATKTAPGTGFASPAPNGAQIHSGVTSGCSACHEAGYVWMGVSAYPISPTTLIPGASYTGFQTRPRAAAGTFNIANAGHPAAGDCSQCHSSTTAFTGVDKPANHIPYNPAAACTACHTSTDFAVLPTLTAIHANAQNPTGNCAQCHGSNAGFYAIPSIGFAIVGQPSNHIPTSVACEACHVGPGSSIATLPVTDGAKFSGSLMNHAGVVGNCVSCHRPAGTAGGFAGISAIVGMPPTSPAGATSHIPSSTKCETCHAASMPAGLIPASSTAVAPGTGFATPAPTGVQIHSGVSSGCSACHEAGYVWMGMSNYPIAPTVVSPGASYTGFQTRPRAAAGTYNVADAAHPATGDCAGCHGSTTAFTSADKPANHIPTNPAATCDACHTTSDYAVMPTIAAIHANAPSTTANCAQCHGSAAASFAIPSAGFSIVGLPSNHIPTSASCEVCHVGTGSSVPVLPVPNGARFSGSLMSHTGISTNCVSCHVAAGTTAAFAGISRISTMPPTSPVGASSHIPSSTACEACHLGSKPTAMVAASATKTAPGTAWATPAPTGAMIHAGISSGCTACHEAGYVWMGMAQYPISPTTLTAGATYKGFQTRPRAAAGTYNVADAAHPVSGDCAQCHGSTIGFTAVDKPANHIPYAAAARCDSCHTNPDFAVFPTIAAVHANAQSTTTNCAQCHGASAASFAIASNGFSIVGLPSNHIPTTASCEVCHVGTGSSVPVLPVPNGAKFSGSLMSHTGITTNCVSCHVAAGTSATFAGITRISTMPATSPVGASAHIPSSTTCETCHLGSKPSTMVPASATKTAPGTAWATPAPTGVQIHTGVTAGCTACHEAGYVWMGMAQYPISPTTLTAGATYNGFQTRPRAAAGTYNVADASHPASGDCVTCHTSTTGFKGVDKPANHIPYKSTAACAACHTSSDYAVMPTLANIHANAESTTVNCAQCHGANAASFAIPSIGFSIVGLPSNHIPTTASCEVCHVGTGSSVPVLPVPNGARFSGSLMSHTGITSNCVSCHVGPGTTAAFAGISRISTMPATSPVGASAHIPSSTVCESCHAGSKPGAMVAASASKSPPGTAWATPAPTGAMIHTGITSGCSACHESNYVWLGMAQYPISPTVLTSGAQYKGFQTRPRSAAGTYNVADAAHPTTGDCSGCHSGTSYFDGAAKPTGHIPTTISTCSTCHVVAGDFSVAGLTTSMATLHTGITSNCRACHVAGTGAGPFAGCTTKAACSSPPPITYQPKVMPLAAGSSPTTPNASTHIPVGTAACEACHSASNFTTFSGTNMKPGTGSSGTAMHTAVASQTCMGCHEQGYKWFGVTIRTRPSDHANNSSRKAPNDCDNSGCHKVASKFDRGLLRPVPPIVMRAAVGNQMRRLLPHEVGGEMVANPANTRFDHRGVIGGQCLTCHNGTAAKGLPKKHYATRVSCDSCHRSTAWRPAQFSHNGVLAGQCQSCHNGVNASGRPGAHFVTVRACDTCHRPLGWQPVNYQHLSPAYRPMPDKSTCQSCHVTNGEFIPRQLHGNPRLRPVPPGKTP